MGKWLRGLGWVGHCSWLGRAGHVKTVLNPCVGHNNEKRCAHLTLHHDEKRRWIHLRGWEERRLVSRLQPHRRPKYIGRRSIYTRFTSPRGNGTRESATFATAARWLPSALLSGPFGRRRGRRRWNRQSRQQRLGRVWLRVDTPPRLRGGISRRRSGVWCGGSAAATGRRRQVVVRRSPGRGGGGGEEDIEGENYYNLIDTQMPPPVVPIARPVPSAPEDTLSVVVPLGLEHGYSFVATLEDGRPFTVSVDGPDGASAGDILEVTYPTEFLATTAVPPTGHWKDGLCACCRFGCCHPMLCLPWCCSLGE